MTNGAYPAASTWAGAIDFHDQSHAWIYGCQLYQWGRDKFDHFFYLEKIQMLQTLQIMMWDGMSAMTSA